MKDKSIQEEIRAGLKNLRLHDWAYEKSNHVFFHLNDSDIIQILKYLDSKGARVRGERRVGDGYILEKNRRGYERLIEE